MTVIFLQSALKRMVEDAIDGMQLESQENLNKKIQVFEQHLPRKIKSKSKQPESTFYPCVIVYLDEWENEQAKILFVVAVYDNYEDNQGYKDAVNIVGKINQEIMRNPLIDKRFELIGNPKCHYSDQENFPYFFSWVETYWSLPTIERDDVEALI